jgi:iron complex outermembrane receptor protein
MGRSTARALALLALTLSARTLHAQAAPEAPVAPDAGALAPDAAAPAPEAGAPEQAPAQSPPQLIAPRVLHSVAPTYPPSHQTHGEHPTVVLKVTILADGSIADATVEHSAGEDFDQAAIAAVKQWKFEPARRGAEPIASRVGVAVHFELPELGVVDVVSVHEASPMVPHPHAEPPPEHRVLGDDGTFGARAEVEAELHSEQRSASDYRIDAAALHAAPRTDGADLLRSAPGMVVARIEGDAVGHRLMLRGFDADHGQDIELKADGVPINQPSHIHGQGYADLGFIIPETVRSLRVIEGVYDPEQGDFAVAGSAEFELGVEQRGITLATSYGAFDTFRELALWAPKQRPKETFAAVSFRKTSGFGQNRAATSGAAVAQGVFGTGRLKLLLHGSAYGSRAATAGVLRRDDIDAGRVGFYDVYPYATAQSQNGFAARAQLSAELRYRGSAGDHAQLTLFYVFNDFRLLANYTGFTETSSTNPEWAGRGDLIEQLNSTRTLGARARYRSAVYRPARWLEGTLELGLAPRVDLIEQRQNLVEAPDNTTWDQRVDGSITGVDIGGYLDADLGFTRFVRLKGGVRADLLTYRVEDRLQNFLPAFRSESYIPGYRRSAAGIAAGPRVVLEVTPIERLAISVAYGEGYRSPQALLLDEGETAPFTKVRSADLGARLTLGPEEQLRLRGSGYFTRLSSDVVFDPREGRAEPVGPSQRLGAVLHADLRIASWLVATASATYVHATLEKPPAPTAEDPNPTFESGQLLPYVPPWVLRADLGGEHALFESGGATVKGRAGLGFTYWSRRPLPFGESSPQVALLDASLGARWRVLSLDCSLLNLLDAEYAALELSYPSNWSPEQPPSRLPARTIMAGAPRTWLLTLGVTL